MSQLSTIMTIPAIQKPVTARSMNHATGSIIRTWARTATDIMEAKAANDLICPALATTRTAYNAPNSIPMKKPAIITPVTSVEKPSSLLRNPSRVPNMAFATIRRP